MQRNIAPILFLISVLQAASHQMPNYTILCPASCICNYISGFPTSADCSGQYLFSVPVDLPRSLHQLLLSNNNISHLECHDLDYMSNLTTLDLSHNTLQTLAGNLTKTTNNDKCCNAISLDINQFQNVPLYEAFSVGQDPRKICKTPLSQLTQLQRLILHDNKISHLDAHTFSGLSNLLYLDLSRNWLITLDPQSFQGLTSLKNLNLYDNFPSSFPDNLFQDQGKLEELNIGYNFGDRLSYLHTHDSASHCYPDQALSKLENLKILRVRGLKLPCVPGPGFRNLTKLSFLDFSAGECEIDSLPEYFFSNISSKANLTFLSFHDGKITFIHNKTFSYIPTLSHVDLSRNSGLGCQNVFSASVSFPETRIKELDVYNINSKDYLRLTASTFKYIGHTSLEVLKMGNNQILIIDKEVAFALPRTLKVLDISDNKLLRGDFLFATPVLINLEILDISKQMKNKVSVDINIPSYDMVEKSDNEVCQMLNKDSFNSQTTTVGKLTTRYRSNNHTGTSFSCINENDKQCNAMKLLNQISEMNTTEKQFSFAQWNLLVRSVCPTYHPNIPTSKLNHTAMTISGATIRRLLTAFSNESLLISSDITNTDSVPPSIPLPRSLRKLYASQLKLGYAIPAFKIIINKVLRHLDVSRDMLWCFDGPTLGLNALDIFDLSNNFAFAISPYFFKGTRNITQLYLSNNNLGSSFELDVQCHILSHLEELEFLDMANCGLQILHSSTFRRNKKLRLINLTRNSLRYIPRISHLRDLIFLDVSFNLIKTLSKKSMSDLDTIKLSSVLMMDITGNPLTCDCSSLEFLKWFQTTNVAFIGRNGYTCTYINGTVLYLNQTEIFISSLWRICHGESVFLISLVLFSVTVFIYLVLALTCYYRYRLLFYVYLNKQRFFSHLYEPEQRSLSDVFLLYDDQDRNCRQHVLQVVIPNLTRHGLTYHVSEVGQENPSAGRSIREVVEESVIGGKKTVVLLTADIFLDDERQLEVSMAKIVEQMLGRRRLLFLVAQKINSKTLPNHIYHLLTVSRLILYSPGSEQFWINLAKEIKD